MMLAPSLGAKNALQFFREWLQSGCLLENLSILVMVNLLVNDLKPGNREQSEEAVSLAANRK
jgi:hypothetical protein